MKKIYKLLFLLFCLISFNLNSQTNIANYSFSTSTGNTYTDLGTNGTILFTGAYDNEISAAITMGGTFPYGGASFTTCYISANGFITFGAAPTGTNYTPLSTLNSTTGAISAYGQDAGGSAAHGSEIRYFHTGPEFIVQYKGHSNYFNSAGEILNFQIRLTYATGAINIIYGACTLVNTSTLGTTATQVGIRGNTVNWTNNVNNLKLMNIPVGTTCTWADVVAGNANTSTMWNAWLTNPNISIPNGLQYSWLPLAAPAPVRTYSAVTLITDNGATLAWTAPAGATQYNVQYRIPGTCGWTNWSGNPVASATVALTGLTPNTTYQIRVQASDGANSSIYSHIPNSAGTGDGYVTAGTFTTAQLACSGTPDAGTISGALIRPTCGGLNPSPTTAVATGFTTGVTGLNLQWEKSTDNIMWSNATGTGATTATYTLPAHVAGQTEYYRLKVTCTPSGLFDVSDVVVQVTDPAAPATQASMVTTSALGNTTATITWASGSGTRRFVKINTVNSFTNPVDGTGPALTSNTVYAGSGEQIVYDNTGSSVAVTGLTQGTTYYVRVYEYIRCGTSPNFTYYYNTTTATNNPGSFTTTTPPPGDVWTTAINIPCGGTVFGDNSLMANEVLPLSTCGVTSNGLTRGVWYKVTPDITGPYAVNSCFATDFDTYLRVYTESASILTCVGNTSGVGYDDDGCSETLYGLSQLAFNATAGVTYYILLTGYSSLDYGLYSLTTSAFCTPPVNDECAGAIDLTPVDGIFTNPGLQNFSAARPSNVPTICDEDFESVMNDVWYSFTTDSDGNNPESATLTVTPVNPSSQIVVAVYDGCSGAIELDCDISATAGAPVTIVLTDNGFTSDVIEVRDNKTYYVKVHELLNNATEFSFNLNGPALPVNILSFNAKTQDKKSVDLAWNVAQEIDVKEYSIQRSNDNKNWISIGSVNAIQKSLYNFRDNNPLQGPNYYRLKINDLNASSTFSEIRTVNFLSTGNMSVYPNPANDLIFVNGVEDKNVVVSIYNEVGQIVSKNVSNGIQIGTGGIDISKLLPGAYSIQVKSDSNITTLRFVKS